MAVIHKIDLCLYYEKWKVLVNLVMKLSDLFNYLALRCQYEGLFSLSI